MAQPNWIVVLGALLLASCAGEPANVYPRPPDQVRELLRTVEIPMFMFGSGDTDFTLDSSDPDKLVWKVTSDDRFVMKYIARLEPVEGGKTRVTLDLEGARQGEYGDVQARLDKMKEIKALYLVGMTEAVDATLDGRAFDITSTYPALVTAGTANAGALFKSTNSSPTGH